MSSKGMGIDQLDSLIYDIYDYFYKNSDDFIIRNIDTNSLKKNRFKLTDYNLDTVFSKISEKVNTLPTGLGFDQIVMKRMSDTFPCNVRIIPYENNDITIIDNPINVHQIIKTLLSDLATDRKTENILIPILNIDVEGSDLSAYQDVIKKKIDEKKFYSIELTEKFWHMETLEDFMQNRVLELDTLVSIFYQIVDVLSQISQAFPDFRHNNLIPSLIDCYTKKSKDGKKTYPVIKLNNYFMAEIPNLVSNQYLKSKSITKINSIYSDLFQFLNHVYYKYKKDIEKYSQLKSFFDEILPTSLRSETDERIDVNKWNKLSQEDRDKLSMINIKNNKLFKVDNHFSIKDQGKYDADMSRNKNKEDAEEEFDEELETDLEEDDEKNDSEENDKTLNEMEKKEIEDNEITVIKNKKKSNNNDIVNMKHKQKEPRSIHDEENVNVLDLDEDDSTMRRTKIPFKTIHKTRKIKTSDLASEFNYAMNRISGRNGDYSERMRHDEYDYDNMSRGMTHPVTREDGRVMGTSIGNFFGNAQMKSNGQMPFVGMNGMNQMHNTPDGMNQSMNVPGMPIMPNAAMGQYPTAMNYGMNSSEVDIYSQRSAQTPYGMPPSMGSYGVDPQSQYLMAASQTQSTPQQQMDMNSILAQQQYLNQQFAQNGAMNGGGRGRPKNDFFFRR